MANSLDFIWNLCNNINMKKVAIFGGTFNPVHNQHIALARQAIKELELDELVVMPTFISPHKSASPAPAEDRLNMLRLAFKNDPKITVSDYEIQKGGKSYTYQTVEHFSQDKGVKLFFIVGADMLENFKTWRYPQRILDACDLVAFGRKDCSVDYEKERQYFKQTFGKEFIKLSYTGEIQSSTQIRVYNSLGLDITDMTALEVCEYIKQNGLYSGDKYTDFIKKSLPEKRRVHTAEVVLSALSKASECGLDADKVRTAALLHDCAKYIDHTTVKDFTIDKDVPPPVIHAFLGAFVAQNILGIDDQEIIDAIRYHTSGKANMTTLAKLIFVADMVEKGRNYEGVDTLREYFKGDLDRCFAKCVEEEMIHLINKKTPIYGETLNAFDFYVKNKGEN